MSAALSFSFAAALYLGVFRGRKLVLAISSLSFIWVSAGMTAVFHPSVTGFLLTAGSAVVLYAIAQ